MGFKRSLIYFTLGFAIGQLYYYYMLKRIPFPYGIGFGLGIIISLLFGIGNACVPQIRCISLLLFPMHCGKPGRSVLKAILLTQVIAGPITTMGHNGAEVVRVFACTAQLSARLGAARTTILATPLRAAGVQLHDEIPALEGAFKTFGKTVSSIEDEVESTEQLHAAKAENDLIDTMFRAVPRSEYVSEKYRPKVGDEEKDVYQKMYMEKMEYKCNNILLKDSKQCVNTSMAIHDRCLKLFPAAIATLVCWPLQYKYFCDSVTLLGDSVCDSREHVDPGFGEGYLYLKKAKRQLSENLRDIQMEYNFDAHGDDVVVQSAKITSQKVIKAFEEKRRIMKYISIAIDVSVALLYVRILISAVEYHEKYLTNIDFDNVYITEYFKRIDQRRARRKKYTVLPLKKVERRYIDSAAIAILPISWARVSRALLELVTATTLVLLDRLLREALDVTRRHVERQGSDVSQYDLEVQVSGQGTLANILRRVVTTMGTDTHTNFTMTNEPCLPRPRATPSLYYFYIYGGYLLVVLLLCVNVYTLSLRRQICSYMYPRRERVRILHLYNDILKKRLKMNKTLRRRGVQGTLAGGEGGNLLMLRLRYPSVLDWMKLLPAARMKCVIYGEQESGFSASQAQWHRCNTKQCGFVSCEECWQEVGKECAVCNSRWSELNIASDAEMDPPRY